MLKQPTFKGQEWDIFMFDKVLYIALSFISILYRGTYNNMDVAVKKVNKELPVHEKEKNILLKVTEHQNIVKYYHIVSFIVFFFIVSDHNLGTRLL